LAGSLIGGLAETQEMLDFCAERGIVSDIEMIGVPQVNEAYERVLKSDVRYRFVMDMSTPLQAALERLLRKERLARSEARSLLEAVFRDGAEEDAERDIAVAGILA